MPVLLSGGIWVQSTLSRVNMLVGSFGLTSIASEFVPGHDQVREVEGEPGVDAGDRRRGSHLGAVAPRRWPTRRPR